MLGCTVGEPPILYRKMIEVNAMKQKFYGGVHPAEHKELAEHKAIEQLSKAPAQVVIPMNQHLGAPCKPIVAKGDVVTVGQKIGEITGLGAPVHASVSGTVVAVEPRPNTNGGKVMSVVIENDFQNTICPDCKPCENVDALTPDEVVNIVKEAGITGMGGAGFPTHVKLSSAIGKVDTIILNGAECEPYITSDHRLMLEQGERVIGGAKILMKALGLNKVYIGVEANKPDAIENLNKLSADDACVEVVSLKTRYPQGAEKQLIQRITDREVPPGGLPAHVGCCVFNVATAAAVYDAVVKGMPLVSRITTVTGKGIVEPKNLEVPLGVGFDYLIEECGGLTTDCTRVIAGGPMMGFAQAQVDVPVGKAQNCVLCFSAAEMPAVDPNPTCIRCAKCVNVCPMHLTPVYMNLYAGKRNWHEVEGLNVMDCIECGSCQYICPARIPLVQMFRTAKGEIRNLQAAAKAKEAAK